MAITAVDKVAGGGTSVTLPLGAPAKGVLMVACCFNSTVPALGTGWNSIDTYNTTGNIFVRTMWRIAGASEPAAQSPTSTASSVIVLATFSSSLGGFNAGTGGIDVHNITHANTAAPPSVTSTALTPGNAGLDTAFVVAIDNVTGDTAPASISGMTNLLTIPTSLGTVVGNGIAAYQTAIGTSSYTKTATWTGATSSGSVICVITFAEFPSAIHGTLSATTGAAALNGVGAHLAVQAPQIVVESVRALQPGPIYVPQIAVEAVRSYQTTPIRAAQVVVEAISPRVVTPTQARVNATGSYIPGFIGQPNPGNKYRIMVYDTSDNLVAIFTNARAFDFIDSVNGGSAAGWFRISVDTSTILAEDTAGTTRSDQYRKNYLGSLNTVTSNIAYTSGPPTYAITFSGNCGQQIVTITLDDYYVISIPIYGNANTPASFAAIIATGLKNYIDQIGSPNPYSVSYTGGTAVVTVNGASGMSYTPLTTGISVHVGVQVSSSFMLPSGLAAAYQQAFQYNYRVQFYLEPDYTSTLLPNGQYSDPDGTLSQPWYDGRINGWTPQVPDTSTDDSYVTVYTEGWQNALNDGIVTETINPGLQPNGVNNGVITADQYLHHLILTYQNNKRFDKPYIAAVPVDLFSMQFQGEGLASCINDVITQVVSDSGHTFEWWVRGLKNVGQGKSLAVVVQPNADPKLSNPYMRIAPTTTPINRYFVYEVKNQTIYDYQVQNTLINLYNMIALYGGRDPTSQLQVYGAFEDSISISLYGLRQQRVTNDNLIAKEALENYGVAYLLLNAYPQPQTTYYKYKPSNKMRAGVWVQVLEPGDGTIIAQTLHQMRSIQVECQLQEDQEKMDQIVTAAAPQPFIDHAYYGAIQQSKGNIPIVIDRGGTVSPNTYIVNGGDWVNTKGSFPATVVLTPPMGHFGKAKQNPSGNPPATLPLDLSLQPVAGQYYPNLGIQLIDSITGHHGDGAYELDFVTNMQEFNPNAPLGAGILVTCVGGPSGIGNSLTGPNVQETPSSPDSLRLWEFVVLNGAIAGAVDMRTFRGEYAGAPHEAQSIILTVPPGPLGKNNVHFQYQAEPAHAKDWYGGFQMGIVGQGSGAITEVILWFAQAGEPLVNLNLPGNTYSPTIYNGDTSWVSSISGQINQIPPPDWSLSGNYDWTPAEVVSNNMQNKPRPITFVTQPQFIKQLPKTNMGALGSGSGPLAKHPGRGTQVNNGGIFQNYNFPGGLGAKITIFIPSIELPVTMISGPPYGAYLFYEMTIWITCTNGNILTTKRQFTIHNAGNGLAS